jgi:hypothetical protein
MKIQILQFLNMKTIVVLVSLVLFGSCQKVIELDLKDAATYMVIEGEVNADDSVHTVRLSNSKNFSSDNVFEAITGATVIISDNLNNSEVLTEVESGVYKTVNFKAVEGRTYYLEVTSNGKKYTANSTIPQRVVLDSMSFIPNGLSSKGGLTPILHELKTVTDLKCLLKELMIKII